ncbi:hypothetical protein [Novosphingobium sp.]|uniref:hypothetical protein n=1 Tax=Novosphingobium sp. TaxID=1874826 RepID=UPI0035B30594
MKRPALIDLGLLLALSLILRAALLGHPNLFIDEAFYTSVGAAMHQGALPYVDVWDRKPFGLFALYWLFTTFSPFPLGYQLAAIVFSGATGWVVSRIALLWTPRRAALSAGALYVLSLGLFQGFGGQSPVFYNLPMALAVLLVLRSRQTLRACGPDGATYLAMVLAGLAITIKTTALFEAGFLGLYAAFLLNHADQAPASKLRQVFNLAFAGATPTLLIAGGYALAGHFPEWWQAMVGANLVEGKWQAAAAFAQGRTLGIVLIPFAAMASFGMAAMANDDRHFMLGWMSAALVGLISVPYFHAHYALPLLVPLAAASSKAFAHPRLGPALLAACAVLLAPAFHPLDRRATQQARQQMDEAASFISQNGSKRGLLVYQGPPYLYVASGAPFPSPLAFPPHLNHAIERNASTLDTAAEVRRILAAKPGVVVIARYVRDAPLNDETAGMVSAYALGHCRKVTEIDVPELLRSDRLIIWGDCR